MKGRIARLLTTRRAEAYALVSLAFILPITALAIVGAYFLIGAGLFIPILLILSLFMFGISLFFVLKRKNSVTVSEPEAEQDLAARPDWSQQDKKIWHQALERIDKESLYKAEWSGISKAMMDQLSFVASCYHGKDKDAEYRVTFLALLLMLETCAREYRRIIRQTVPFSKDITLSNLRFLYKNQERIQTGGKIIGFAWRLWRLKLNPVNALAQELSSASDKSVMSKLTDHMQDNLKRMLLQEVSQVSIDLYSGRLIISEPELRDIQTKIGGTLDLVTARPLTIVVIGQINSGKSSLVNALANKCVSETDVIPCSDRVTRHRMTLQGDIEVDLVDTPGIDGDHKTSEVLLEAASNADLVLWLSQANQPAKALDAELIRAWKAYFERHQNRRVPPLVLVTSHNDMLAPSEGWKPPYNLNATDDPKVKIMLEAIQYTRESLGLDADYSALPICIAPDKVEYNVQTLLDLIISMSEQARASQLNRDRIAAAENRSFYDDILSPLMGLGKVAGRAFISNT